MKLSDYDSWIGSEVNILDNHCMISSTGLDNFGRVWIHALYADDNGVLQTISLMAEVFEKHGTFAKEDNVLYLIDKK